MFVYSLYKFIDISNLNTIRDKIFRCLDKLNIKGTVLISKEGININISQEYELLENAIENISKVIELDDVHINRTKSNGMAFQKLKVKIKAEIIKFNYEFQYKNKNKLQTVTPDTWNKLLNNHVQIIDMRNDFEYSLGTFKNAINLRLKNFSDLKDRIAELDKLDKNKKTAIFCTGGIRCEKAGKFLNEHGFSDVYQLGGGIINYLNNKQDYLWKGDCFVFDDRILLKSDS